MINKLTYTFLYIPALNTGTDFWALLIKVRNCKTNTKNIDKYSVHLDKKILR